MLSEEELECIKERIGLTGDRITLPIDDYHALVEMCEEIFSDQGARKIGFIEKEQSRVILPNQPSPPPMPPGVKATSWHLDPQTQNALRSGVLQRGDLLRVTLGTAMQVGQDASIIMDQHDHAQRAIAMANLLAPDVPRD